MDNLVLIIIATALAAGVGATLRFIVSGYLNNDFPFGTLAVNLVASFALGIIVSADDPLPTIVGIGALGALSTWSNAANEAATMSRNDRGGMAAGYLGLMVSSGVLAAWFGLQLGPLIL